MEANLFAGGCWRRSSNTTKLYDFAYPKAAFLVNECLLLSYLFISYFFISIYIRKSELMVMNSLKLLIIFIQSYRFVVVRDATSSSRYDGIGTKWCWQNSLYQYINESNGGLWTTTPRDEDEPESYYCTADVWKIGCSNQ